MRAIKLIILSLFAAMLLPNESSAQRDLYNWQISPYGGLLTIDSDIELPSDIKSYVYGLRIERRLGNSFTLGLNLQQLQINDDLITNGSGGFFSLGYHWDNGYILRKGAGLSVFHRIEAGYMDRYDGVESIDEISGELTFGFENGIKLRLGDRITADLALELFSSQENLTEGDFFKNARYNVWKLGVSYHFSSRKSDYRAPVFVPYNGNNVMTTFDKIEADGVRTNVDSVYKHSLMGGIRDTLLVTKSAKKNNSGLTRADSLLIFMHFDSLYQRRDQLDTLTNRTDTAVVQKYNTSVNRDSTFIQDTIALKNDVIIGDSVVVADTLVTPDQIMDRDTVIIEKVIPVRDTISTIDTKMRKDSIRLEESKMVVDSTLVLRDSDSAKLGLRSDSIITRVDTIFIENPKNVSQVADTISYSREVLKNRVDTVYIEKSAPEESKSDTSEVKGTSKTVIDSGNNDDQDDDSNKENANDNDGKKENQNKPVIIEKSSNDNGSLQSSINRQNDRLNEQNREIQRNRAEIEELRKNNRAGDAGKLVAAGAAGTALGALVRGGKNKTDTVYYESAAAQHVLDSLAAEIAALKLQYGIVDSTAVLDSTAVGVDYYVPNPPIGSYFDNDSLQIDSVSTVAGDTLVRAAVIDSVSTTDKLNDVILSPVVVSSPVDSTTVLLEDTSSVAVPEKPIELDVESMPLKGSYPIECIFGLNKMTLADAEILKLDVVVDDLKNDESRSVLLIGYTDKSGNADYNLQLSKKRAMAVMEYLVSKGISKDRIETKGGGISEGAEQFQANSRRVEITVVKK